MLHKTFVSSVLVLGLSTAAFGQVKLERKYPEGSTYTAESTSHIEQKLTIAGMETDTSSDTRTTVKATESEGVILFDREVGQVVETSGSIRIEGDITFVFNNMDLPSKLDLKMQSGVVVKR